MTKRFFGRDKEVYIERMFSSIAPKYDLMNSVLSLNMHKAWRKFAVSQSGIAGGGSALDVCCGTGDFAFELAEMAGETGRVVGLDFSAPMIELARDKARKLSREWVSFVVGNACELPFEDSSFDCVTMGFGLRNVADVSKAVSEMARVTKPGGKVVNLEISKVRSPLLRLPWMLYFYALTPYTASMFGAKREAYEYLPQSVKEFVSREELCGEFERAGLGDVRYHDLMFGAVCLHIGTKQEQ